MSPEALAKGDEKKITAWRLKKLAEWEAGLRDALRGKKAPPVLKAFAHTLGFFKIPLPLPLDLLKAYRMDLRIRRYATWKDLLFYCRHSANPVGRMVLFISGIRGEKIHQASDFICSGLQLINFWQDSAIDLKKGRIYYPQSELEKAGATPRDLLALKDSPASRRLVKAAVDYTEDYFDRGLPLLSALSGRLRWEIKATFLGGRGILKKIRRMDYNVLNQRPAWTLAGKISLAAQALFTHPRSTGGNKIH